MRAQHRYIWWICLTLLALSVPLGFTSHPQVTEPATRVFAGARGMSAPSHVQPDELDICLHPRHKAPVAVTIPGHGAHLFCADDQDAAPRMHRRASLGAAPFILAEFFSSAASQIPAASEGESPAIDLPTGRAPPAV